MNLSYRAAVLAASSLAFSLSAVPPTAFASQPAQPGALAVGRVVSDGSPIAGADVIAYALPRMSTLAAAPAGTTIPMWTLGHVRTTPAGTFVLPLTPGSVPADARDETGIVNVELIAVSGGEEMATHFPARFTDDHAGHAGWFAPAADRGHQQNADLAFDFGAGTAVNAAVDPASEVGEDGKPEQAAVADKASKQTPRPVTADLRRDLAAAPTTQGSQAAPSITCGMYATNNWEYGRNEHFTTTNTASGIPETVTEETSSTHTLGIALQGGSGAWSQSGDASITHSSSTSSSTTFSDSHTIYNRINYREWLANCLGYEWLPTSFYDLLPNIGSTVGEANLGNCSIHRPGDTWSTSSATNVTYGAGMSLAELHVSAQSGYGSSVRLSYKFNVTGDLCGNSSSGPASSSVVATYTL